MDSNSIDDFSFNSNYLLDAVDDQLMLAHMINDDPWIGDGICDPINSNFLNDHNHSINDIHFKAMMMDEDEMDSSKSSISSASPVPIKCEIIEENEIEVTGEEFADSPLSFGGSSGSGSCHHESSTDRLSHRDVISLNNQNSHASPVTVKSEPSSTKSSPKTSPKLRNGRNKQITDLVLTEEERRLLAKEGYHDFPCGNLPLTKHEEKILRKIRRKIRNKKSAQCSRQRKKEYLEDLERRFDERNMENEQLKKEVIKLKKENDTLMMKMRKLLLMNGQANASYKSSFFVLILSFLLILVPYFRPDVDSSLGLSEKFAVGTGRHLLMTFFNGGDQLANNSVNELTTNDSNDTIFNYTTTADIRHINLL